MRRNLASACLATDVERVSASLPSFVRQLLALIDLPWLTIQTTLLSLHAYVIGDLTLRPVVITGLLNPFLHFYFMVISVVMPCTICGEQNCQYAHCNRHCWRFWDSGLCMPVVVIRFACSLVCLLLL